jgi:hypothetical protein
VPTTGVHVFPDSNRVRLITNGSTNNDSVIFDWDYEFNAWSRQVLTADGDGANLRSATLANGKYYIADSSLGILEFVSRIDSDGSASYFQDDFDDSDYAINMQLKTAWIRPTGSTLVNQRATHGYLLGKDMGSGHSVTVEVAFDYDETFTTVGTFAATSFPQIRFRMPRLSWRAIMFRITEVADGSPGEGIELNALGLELATEGTTGGRLLDS